MMECCWINIILLLGLYFFVGFFATIFITHGFLYNEVNPSFRKFLMEWLFWIFIAPIHLVIRMLASFSSFIVSFRKKIKKIKKFFKEIWDDFVFMLTFPSSKINI